jgi:NAD(P)-dependent dehydrogenase (short-subunit alcohol dehydrogenase family)
MVSARLSRAAGRVSECFSVLGTFGLRRLLAIDYVKRGIRVNAVLPGTVNSPLVTTLFEDPAKRAEYLGKIPMGRPADVPEIANVIALLGLG